MLEACLDIGHLQSTKATDSRPPGNAPGGQFRRCHKPFG
jgi:hypothetical protein